MRTPFILPSLCLGVALLLVGCGTHKRAHKGPSSPLAPSYFRLSEDQARDLAVHAIGLIDTPYRGGGNTPAGGFDCSGLISYVYISATGLAPPRTVAQLSRFGSAVSARQARSGDLVLFGSKHGTPTHAGIYVGEGRFVHAPSKGGYVRMEYVNSIYWSTQNPRFRRL